MKINYKEKFKEIDTFIFDVDGVLNKWWSIHFS